MVIFGGFVATHFYQRIPFNTHLILDALAGLAFLIAPFLFGFEGLIRWFYLVNGAIVLLLVLVTNPRISRVEVS